MQIRLLAYPALLLCLASSLRGQAPIDLSTVKIELNGVFTNDPKAEPLPPPDKMEPVVMGMWVTGLPTRFVVKVDRVDVKLEEANGAVLDTAPAVDPDANFTPQGGAIQAALGEVRLLNGTKDTFDNLTMFSLRADAKAKHWNTRFRFSSTIDFALSEYQLTQASPVDLNKRRDSSAKIAAVEVVTHDDTSLTVSIKPAGGASDNDGVYVIRNTERKEAVLGASAEVIGEGGLIISPLGRGKSGLQYFDLSSITGPATDWLAKAEIVRLDLKPVSRFTRTFHRDPLQLSFDIPGQHGKESDYDKDALASITLPPNASREQMLAYASAILEVSMRQKERGYEDPQVEMFKKLGAKNLDILIEVSPVPRINKHLHLWKAINDLVGDEHKELVISRLKEKPDLAQVVDDEGWNKDARTILVGELKSGRDDLPCSWIEAVIALNNSSNNDLVIAYYHRHPTMLGLFEAVSDLPGFDREAELADAWENAKSASPRERIHLANQAAEIGSLDALGFAVELLRAPQSDFQRRVGRRILTERTAAEGDDAKLLEWYDTNAAKLKFDPDTKQFVPQGS